MRLRVGTISAYIALVHSQRKGRPVKMNFKGKNVIYIGGFGGIGQRCVEEFLKKEVKNLIIFDLTQDDEYLKYLRETYASTNVAYIPIDMSKRETIENAYNRAMDEIGHLDAVVNGSGIMNESLVDLTVAVNLWQYNFHKGRTIDSYRRRSIELCHYLRSGLAENTTGLIHSTLIALNSMDTTKGGSGGVIVNMSSVAGLEPTSMMSIYTATKFGVTGFTRALANPVYFEKTGVSFITICPGPTSTAILSDMQQKMTMPDCSEPFMDFFTKLSLQHPEEFSSNFIKVLEKAENGTVWLLDGGKFERIEYPVMWNPILKE